MTLVQARTLIGWNQTDLARESQQSNSTISDLEAGDNKNPSYSLVMSVIGALQRGGLKNLTAEDIFPVKKKAVA
jgi:transcriptional regulator with XRE-family HTH domain